GAVVAGRGADGVVLEQVDAGRVDVKARKQVRPEGLGVARLGTGDLLLAPPGDAFRPVGRELPQPLKGLAPVQRRRRHTHTPGLGRGSAGHLSSTRTRQRAGAWKLVPRLTSGPFLGSSLLPTQSRGRGRRRSSRRRCGADGRLPGTSG